MHLLVLKVEKSANVLASSELQSLGPVLWERCLQLPDALPDTLQFFCSHRAEVCESLLVLLRLSPSGTTASLLIHLGLELVKSLSSV